MSTVAAVSEDAQPAPPTTVEKLRGLPWSYLANSANTVFAQFTWFGSTFVLMLSALGMSKGQIGLLLSLVPFGGLIALFIGTAVARAGYKRTFIIFYALRKTSTAALLLTPWVLAAFGQQAMVIFVIGVATAFALTKSVAETGYFPWYQEFIPRSMLGRYSATNSVYTVIVGLISVTAAGYVLDRSSELSSYMLLIGVGVVFGFVAVYSYTHIPGGAPVRVLEKDAGLWRGMAEAARDGNFTRYLLGAALIILGTAPVVSFVPLFMQEQVGLSSGHVVLLQSGGLIGTLLSSLPVGWASDRYGGKPLMIIGLALKVLLPILWVAMPRHSDISLYAGIGIAVILGISEIAWAIGAGRLLYGSVVPPAKKTAYMSLHYAWVGLIGGIGALLGGWILGFTAGLSGSLLGLPLDPYLPLFGLGFVLTLASTLVLLGMRADNRYGVGEFAGMFFRGNPFLAMTSVIRYYMARTERSTISMAEHLGRAKSPLALDELIDTLEDPRFHVRFEAIVSLARMPADARVIEALTKVLEGTEVASTSMAAWALGRLGDRRAVAPLRQSLDSGYRSIRAQSARALGALRDPSVAGELLERLEQEEDIGLLMAYASALGNLRAREALPVLIRLMPSMTNPGARMELALSIARILGNERRFIDLLRQARRDLGTAVAQELVRVQRRWVRRGGAQLEAEIKASADAFAHGDEEAGAAHFTRALTIILEKGAGDAAGSVLAMCAEHIGEYGAEHPEYVLLALHTLHSAAGK